MTSHRSNPPVRRGWLHAALVGVPALAGLLVLGGCSGSSEPGVAPAATPWGQFLRGTTAEPKEIDPESYKPIVRCPRVIIRPGTNTHVILHGKLGDPNTIGFQATLTETARECAITDATISIKVGVAGRVLAGSKGGTLNSTLPVRIVVVGDDDKPIYSKLHQVPVSIVPPASSTNWAFVDDQISIPVGGTPRIYVGFDDGGKGSALEGVSQTNQ